MSQASIYAFVSQNYTVIILSTKCLYSNALRESAVNKINCVTKHLLSNALRESANLTAKLQLHRLV